MGTKYRGTKTEVRALNAFIKLARAAQTVSSRVDAPLSGIGLTVSRFGVLEALFHLGPMNQKSLAERILRSTGNMTTVVDNLEKRGLVMRVRDDADRRHYSVRITDRGASLIRSCLPGHVDRIVRQMSALNAPEQDELARLCRKLGLSASQAASPSKGSRTT